VNPDIQSVLSGERRWCVVTGDSWEILRGLPDASVAHTVCDPPYDDRTHKNAITGAANDFAADASTAGVAFSSFSGDDFARLAGELVRVSKRWVVAFGTIETVGDYQRGAGAAWVRAGVWDRISPAPQITGDRPASAVDAVSIMHRKGKKRWNRGGGAGIWRFQVERGADRPDHPTPKPVALMRALVEDFTDPGDVILDPFCGSGTTLVAALSTGRRCIGIELNPKHADLAAERARAAESGLTLNAARAGQISLFGAAQ